MSYKSVIKLSDKKFFTVMDYTRGGELIVLLEGKKGNKNNSLNLLFWPVYLFSLLLSIFLFAYVFSALIKFLLTLFFVIFLFFDKNISFFLLFFCLFIL